MPDTTRRQVWCLVILRAMRMSSGKLIGSFINMILQSNTFEKFERSLDITTNLTNRLCGTLRFAACPTTQTSAVKKEQRII